MLSIKNSLCLGVFTPSPYEEKFINLNINFFSWIKEIDLKSLIDYPSSFFGDLQLFHPAIPLTEVKGQHFMYENASGISLVI